MSVCYNYDCNKILNEKERFCNEKCRKELADKTTRGLVVIQGTYSSVTIYKHSYGIPEKVMPELVFFLESIKNRFNIPEDMCNASGIASEFLNMFSDTYRPFGNVDESINFIYFVYVSTDVDVMTIAPTKIVSIGEEIFIKKEEKIKE